MYSFVEDIRVINANKSIKGTKSKWVLWKRKFTVICLVVEENIENIRETNREANREQIENK